jgi:hypothetical protein
VTHESYRSVVGQLQAECNGARKIFTPDILDPSHNNDATMCVQLRRNCFPLWEQLFTNQLADGTAEAKNLLDNVVNYDAPRWRCEGTRSLVDAEGTRVSSIEAPEQCRTDDDEDGFGGGKVCHSGANDVVRLDEHDDQLVDDGFVQLPLQSHWDYYDR